MYSNLMIQEYRGDGVFKVRRGNHGEKLLQVSADLDGEWRRFTSDDRMTVTFKKV